MKPTAIVYTSNTGHAERYARMLSEKTGLPIYRLETEAKSLAKGTAVLYLGWLFASSVKGYGKAKKRFAISAVCGVGLCATGTMLDEVRKSIRLKAEIPLFTVQGGMDHDKLVGINKKMIDTLTKFMRGKKNKTEDDKKMIELLENGGDFVSEEHLADILAWLEGLSE